MALHADGVFVVDNLLCFEGFCSVTLVSLPLTHLGLENHKFISTFITFRKVLSSQKTFKDSD